jgi:YjbE family integral membrane protein
LWIGVKLLVEDDHVDESAVKQPPNLMGAVRTIIIADFVMSLDNSIAIAAAAKGNMYLVVFGLVLSVPIIIAGSALILRLMTRFPLIIAAGGALLGWLAGDMIATDPLLVEELNTHTGHAPALAAALGAGLVVVTGMILKRRGGQSAQ